jgi:hypothetical protein
MTAVTIWLLLALTPKAAIDYKAPQFIAYKDTQEECIRAARAMTDALRSSGDGAAFCVAAVILK